VLYDGLPYDPIQGQGQGHIGPKVVKVADFIVYLICHCACNQKTIDEL